MILIPAHWRLRCLLPLPYLLYAPSENSIHIFAVRLDVRNRIG
jgi:hypothetical protein